ncbi:helix-turn-helix domain-containing protein [Allokutzneria albata]|uniref:Helix-turn-helix domain-containing protein n=1 Tax=Allokutzneria albata TaxID=211114 RepID=A0A1H0A2H1_ALLAB|nr:helix-turn-helix transcriptional regulator [Allokutzneria albata]SDN26876.1 Helix-turn-helix domain-containing protein [Allokutzneria albata]
MNTIGSQGSPVTPEVWEQQEMRDALAARDISSVYRLLRRHGVSQRQIAALTGQSQSEVSEILKGRQVMAYDVLARIADGLDVPRGYMGLAYDGGTAMRVVGPPDDPQAEEEESVKRRMFLAHAAAITMGASVFGQEQGHWVTNPTQTPARERIGKTDVQQVEAATKALRALDYQYGGGTCRDAVVAQLSWAEQLLRADAAEPVRRRLQLALADLHSLAGWTSFDTGMLDPARNHFGKALQFAKHSEHNELVANILYRMGRVYLHYEAPNDALKLFQLGQLAAQDSGSALTVAVLCANEAWAYAMMGKRDQAMKMVGRTKDEFARADFATAPDWVKFFTVNDLHGMIGSVHHSLAGIEEFRAKHAPLAVAELIKCTQGYESDMKRTHVFGLSMLAADHIRAGDVDQGLRVGRVAFDMGEGVNSVRVADRMNHMQEEAVKYQHIGDAKELADDVQQFRLRTGSPHFRGKLAPGNPST